MKERIDLGYGDGGELAHQLIQHVFVKAFGHHREAERDAAVFTSPGKQLAITTDSFVIKPLFFPGGTIGKLAVAGTVNDLAVSGAKPLYLTASFIIEEGFPIADLKRVVHDMAEEAERAGVRIVAGDTKVVERGSADGLFINTTGIGVLSNEMKSAFQAGDAVIVSGPVGDHGIAVLAARGELGLETELESDCASLNHILQELLQEVAGVRIMRDPTRGGLATTLVEICESEQLEIELDETAIPVRAAVHGACDLLGMDPLYLANEGKAVMVLAAKDADKALAILNKYSESKEAAVIGTVQSTERGRLILKTPLGTHRPLHRLANMQLPRIC